jgi:tRNA modification GTPase
MVILPLKHAEPSFGDAPKKMISAKNLSPQTTLETCGKTGGRPGRILRNWSSILTAFVRMIFAEKFASRAAKTEKARNLAINQLDGKVSNLIKDLRNDIIQILANIEVNIDYPEYEDIEELTNEKVKPMLNDLE